LLPDCSFSTLLCTGNDTLGDLKEQYCELEPHTGRGASGFSHLRLDIMHVEDYLGVHTGKKKLEQPNINPA